MDEKTSWQSLEKNGPITEYNEPFIEQRADPFVCKAADGTYYFTASYPAYDRILLRSSKTLNGLKDAKERQIWVKHEHGLMSCHIWAPELHFVYGKWYIYFAAGEAEDVWKIRPYVLECDGDPMTGEWSELGPMKGCDDDPFSLQIFHWMQQSLSTRVIIIMFGHRRHLTFPIFILQKWQHQIS